MSLNHIVEPNTARAIKDHKERENVMSKVREHLEQLKQELESQTIYREGLPGSALDIVNALLEDLAAEGETTDWNLIGEKAPEETGTYMVTYNGVLVGEKYPFTGLGFFDDGEWDDEECIIAWKPLPEPYKEGKNVSSM